MKATEEWTMGHHEASGRLDELLAALKASGTRMTPQRMAILRVLVEHPGHPTAADIHAALHPQHPTMSLATVYKTLTLLKERGEVLELEFSARDNRYDGKRPHAHPHLICTRCGSVVDPQVPDLSGVLADLARSTGYTLTSHRLDFYGVCPACREEDDGSTT